MSKQSQRNAGSASRRQPEAFFPTGIEPLLMEAAGHLAVKYGPPLAEAVYHAFKARKKIFVQIDASWKAANDYFVAFSLRNLTGHGLYLEAISLDEPRNQQFDLARGYPRQEPRLMNFGSASIKAAIKAGSVLPILLEVGVDHAEEFTFRLPDASKLETVKLTTAFTPLDQPEPGWESKVIRLRQDGPAFRKA